jgi:hypothetical protein
MILVEIERNREYILESAPYCILIFNKTYEEINGIETYCTMRKGTNLCNIEHKPNEKDDKTRKQIGKKFPKLSELYLKLFENSETPINLHNSMIDVMVCLSCYLKMRHNITNDYTKDMSVISSAITA